MNKKKLDDTDKRPQNQSNLDRLGVKGDDNTCDLRNPLFTKKKETQTEISISHLQMKL